MATVTFSSVKTHLMLKHRLLRAGLDLYWTKRPRSDYLYPLAKQAGAKQADLYLTMSPLQSIKVSDWIQPATYSELGPHCLRVQNTTVDDISCECQIRVLRSTGIQYIISFSNGFWKEIGKPYLGYVIFKNRSGLWSCYTIGKVIGKAIAAIRHFFNEFSTNFLV